MRRPTLGGGRAPLGALGLALALAACDAPLARTPAAGSGRSSAEQDRAIERARSMLVQHMESTDVPGMQVAVWRDDRLVWSEGLGWADVENRVAVMPSTRFPIGSVSKVLTAVAAARLADRGLLDVDAEIRSYLPDLPAAYDAVTTRLLGQHLSGVRHYRRAERAGDERHYDSVGETLEIFVEGPLLFEPGDEFTYSSYGYNLLAAVMERAASRDFLSLMDRELIGPLGLEGTRANEIDRDIPLRSVGYDGRRKPADVEDPSYKWAGGGFLSTAEDLARVGAALLEPGYLSEQALELLVTEGRPRSGERTYFGFGLQVYGTPAGHRVYYHGGNLPYARAHLVVFPEERLVAAVLANTGTNIYFNWNEAQLLAEFFLPRPDAAIEAEPEDWAGAYTFRLVAESLAQDTAGAVTVVTGDTLSARLTLGNDRDALRGSLVMGGPPLPVPVAIPRGDTLDAYFLRGTWRTLRLMRDAGAYRGTWEEEDPPSGRLRLGGDLLEIRRMEDADGLAP